MCSICDVLRDLVPFVQFKKSERHPSRSVTFKKVAGFSMFFELYKWYQIAQSISYNLRSCSWNGLRSASYLGPKIWSMVPDEIKNQLSRFLLKEKSSSRCT